MIVTADFGFELRHEHSQLREKTEVITTSMATNHDYNNSFLRSDNRAALSSPFRTRFISFAFPNANENENKRNESSDERKRLGISAPDFLDFSLTIRQLCNIREDKGDVYSSQTQILGSPIRVSTLQPVPDAGNDVLRERYR